MIDDDYFLGIENFEQKPIRQALSIQELLGRHRAKVNLTLELPFIKRNKLYDFCLEMSPTTSKSTGAPSVCRKNR